MTEKRLDQKWEFVLGAGCVAASMVDGEMNCGEASMSLPGVERPKGWWPSISDNMKLNVINTDIMNMEWRWSL